jgi:hypothetical protein
MKIVFAAFITCFFLGGVPSGLLAQPTQEPSHVPGEMLIQLTSEGALPELESSFAQLGGELIQLKADEVLIPSLNIWKFRFNEEANEYALLRALRLHPTVVVAQFNHYVTRRQVPNDPNIVNQWHHINGNDKDIDSDLAWDITTGGTTATGDEIVVCVIEGGNLNHPDLVPNKWVNDQEIANNGIDDDANGYIDDFDGWNVESNNDDGVFTGGHGTQVMGMIGARGNNSVGVAGINWNVKIMSVAGENLSDEASVVEAYNYPLVMRDLYNETGGTSGAFVVVTNASWGIDNAGPEEAPLWCAVYDALGEVGVLNCGATANNNVNIDVVGDLPTACPSEYMVSVTATNNSDQRTFSAYGLVNVDLGAPGESVWTTSGNNNYGAASGTSFASPLTAGAIALLYAAPCPALMELVYANPQAGADIIREALFDGVDPVAQLENETVTGGRLNVFNSLNILINNCNANECLAPFGVVIDSQDGLDFSISWSALETAQSFNIRYREVGVANWEQINNWNTQSFNLTELLWCTTYEVQLQSNCEWQSSDWTQSHLFETDGCCIAPDLSGLQLTDESETSLSFSWENVLAATAYELGIAVTGSEAYTYYVSEGNAYSFVGLEPCKSYDIILQTVCEGGEGSGFTQEITEITPGCGNCTDFDFCGSLSQDASDEWISLVYLNEISNSSGSDGGYGDYTDISTPLVRGNNYEIILHPGFAGFQYSEYFRAWIDYNQDGIFGEDELVFDAGQASSSPVTGDIVVPENAIVGSTRLRVSMKYYGFFGSPQVACETMEYGEVEDYCVVIEEMVGLGEKNPTAFEIYPNPVSSSLQIIFSGDPEGAVISLIDFSGRLLFQQRMESAATALDISSLASGMYFLKIGKDGEGTQTRKFEKID